MRAIPVLVVLVWIYFAVPILIGINFHPFWAALIALTLHIAAYVAEIVRAGIESIRPGQMRAASRSACRARRSCARSCCRRPHAHAAGLRLDPVDHDQGHRDRHRDRGARADEARRDASPARATGRSRSSRSSMVVYFLILFPGTRLIDGSTSASRTWGDHESGLERRVWQHRDELWHGALLTVLLTVLTMLVAVPGGIVLALMRLSHSKALVAARALAFVEFFRNLPLILVVYWVFYVMPVLLHIEFSAFTTGLVALASTSRPTTPRPSAPASTRSARARWRRPRGRHEPLAGDEQDRAAAGLAARAAGAGEHLGVAVQGHLAGIGDRGRRARPCGAADPLADASACWRC